MTSSQPPTTYFELFIDSARSPGGKVWGKYDFLSVCSLNLGLINGFTSRPFHQQNWQSALFWSQITSGCCGTFVPAVMISEWVESKGDGELGKVLGVIYQASWSSQFIRESANEAWVGIDVELLRAIWHFSKLCCPKVYTSFQSS